MVRAPSAEIAFTLKHVAGMSEGLAAGLFGHLSEDLVDAILGEAGRFADDVLAPLNRAGDRHGARFEDGRVTTAPGWREAYRAFCEGGWNGLTGPAAHGGQNLPTLLLSATQEMWNVAAMAFATGPMLTVAAVEALERHGAPGLKDLYLPKLVSGEWFGTMNMTEPQAGSDLSTLKTRAERRPDGTYRLFGQKLFITYGEHDLTDNIVHMVLARLSDAPAGTRGLSLFLVPKFLVNADGSLGPRNDVRALGIEHKMGIHGSPTCTMVYGGGFSGDEPGAVGWLVGEENRGLNCMFTMMNNARLAVGIQGVGIAERALQQAVTYARERRQGRTPGIEGTSPIIAHPDIRRTLLAMHGLTAASRALCYSCAHAIDMARMGGAPGASARAAASDLGGRPDAGGFWATRANLLTPVAKAFSTDAGFEVASMGVQVHGGMGYIEETGAAQTLRDARIAMIYEGTNGIQAIDLVTRKLPQENGGHVRGYIAELREIAGAARRSNRAGFGRMGERLESALDDLAAATSHLLACLEGGRMDEALAGATPYLRLFGLTAGGAYLAKGALASGDADEAARRRIAVARAFAERLAPETAGLRVAVTEGAGAVLDVEPDLFGSTA